MYVCVCKAVTEKQIFNAAQNGAKTVKDLKETLGVASECTSCVGCAKACLKSAHETLNATGHHKHKHFSIQLLALACAA
ncbi:MAG: (2Fe-2S)-binding protein [Methylophilaceae bacterium]